MVVDKPDSKYLSQTNANQKSYPVRRRCVEIETDDGTRFELVERTQRTDAVAQLGN